MELFWVIDEHRRQVQDIENKKGIICTKAVNQALTMAYEAHKAQQDIAGRPYILRLLHIAGQMQGELAVCAALLHDVPQHGVTMRELADAGFSDELIAIVNLLSQNRTASPRTYAQSIVDSGHSIAADIALTGLLYDCDLTKFETIDQHTVDWYYQNMDAIAVLENAVNDGHWRDSEMAYIYDAVSTRVIDIKAYAPGIGGRLSNLTKRSFCFCDMACDSIEGVLQSFKFPDPAQQYEICRLHGFKAKKAGKEQDWQTLQMLYWKGELFPRDSQAYQALLDSLYLAAFQQNESFRRDLQMSKDYTLRHSIGLDDPHETILTIDEFIRRLVWLRGCIDPCPPTTPY